MRHLFLAALGVFAVSGAASAQQPQYQPAPRYPVAAPASAAGAPLAPASGTTVISGGAGCSNCGPTVRGGFTMSGAAGGNCALGNSCQSGCGSLKSDLGFHFGSCKSFFSPCGPAGHHGGLFKNPCPITPIAQPWGQGWTCPRIYDSYANH